MKILHVAPSFYPALTYGGPIHSVHFLCEALAHNGCELKVLTTNADGLSRVLSVPANREIRMDSGFTVRYCQRNFRHSVSAAFVRALPEHVRWADVVHLTAIYSFPVIPTLLAARTLHKPLVWSPRGALQRWQG